VRVNLGILDNEYKESLYFWGIFVIFFKMVIMLLASFLDSNPILEALTIFMTIYAYYVMLIRGKPYFSEELFRAEKITVETYLITLFAIIYFYNNSLEVLQWISVGVVLALNAYVVLRILAGVIELLWTKVQHQFQPMMTKWKSNDMQLDLDFRSDNLHFSFEEQRQKKFKKLEDIKLVDIEDLVFGKDSDLESQEDDSHYKAVETSRI
jgi:hypothetical protein